MTELQRYQNDLAETYSPLVLRRYPWMASPKLRQRLRRKILNLEVDALLQAQRLKLMKAIFPVSTAALPAAFTR